jgi:hypothetical protein
MINIILKNLGIDTSAPEFYNDPIFLGIERETPSTLKGIARCLTPPDNTCPLNGKQAILSLPIA